MGGIYSPTKVGETMPIQSIKLTVFDKIKEELIRLGNDENQASLKAFNLTSNLGIQQLENLDMQLRHYVIVLKKLRDAKILSPLEVAAKNIKIEGNLKLRKVEQTDFEFK